MDKKERLTDQEEERVLQQVMEDLDQRTADMDKPAYPPLCPGGEVKID